jgi:hypothetical protein
MFNDGSEMLIEGEDCVRVLYSFILNETGDEVYLYSKRVLYHYMETRMIRALVGTQLSLILVSRQSDLFRVCCGTLVQSLRFITLWCFLHVKWKNTVVPTHRRGAMLRFL